MPDGKRRTAVHVALGAVFAVAWRYDLLLVVVAMPAAAIAIVVRERLAEQAAARRAAALAIHTPVGVHAATSLEDMIAADLAAVAGDDLDALVDASGLVEASLSDPWRRALAGERLDRAAAHARRSPVPPPVTLSVLRHRATMMVAAASAVGLLAASAWGESRMTLAPLAVAVAAVALAGAERRRALATRHALALEAAALPAQGSVFVPEAAIVAAIEAITNRRPRAHHLATSLVATWAGPEAEHAARRVRAVPGSRTRLSRADRAVAVWASAAAALTLLTGV